MPTTTTEEPTMTATHTCTVRSATRGACGQPAVYVEGPYAECATHAAEPGSMASTQHMVHRPAGEHRVGDVVTVHRYGKAYRATVVHVGAKGAAYAEWVYGNGAKRRARV